MTSLGANLAWQKGCWSLAEGEPGPYSEVSGVYLGEGSLLPYLLSPLCCQHRHHQAPFRCFSCSTTRLSLSTEPRAPSEATGEGSSGEGESSLMATGAEGRARSGESTPILLVRVLVHILSWWECCLWAPGRDGGDPEPPSCNRSHLP